MTSIAILGAGAGGAAAAVQLAQAGHEVALWSRSEATVAPFRDSGVRFTGALGEGRVEPALVTVDLSEAMEGAEVAVVCLPAIAHEELARSLASKGWDRPMILNPGGMGGALVFRKAFIDERAPLPPIAELSTLTFIARKPEPGAVSVFAIAKSVHAACLPGGEPAISAAGSLFGGIVLQPHVLATSLRNVNLVLHPPVALLSAAWVEATGGEFFIYSEAVTPGVFRVMEAFDAERRAFGAALGLDLPPIVHEMMEVGSVDEEAFQRGDGNEAIARGEANRTIKAPGSLSHRYYQEDLPYAVLPFVELARVWDVDTPVAGALLTIGSALLGYDVRAGGLNAARLGIDGLGPRDLLDVIGGPA